MYRNLRKMLRDESGLSALETAIVLISFVVVAAVFAFTMLSAGMFATERSKEAIYAGLEGVGSTLELRGSVLLTTTTEMSGTVAGTAAVDTIIFTVSNAAGGSPVDLHAPNGSEGNSIVILYSDKDQLVPELGWTVEFLGKNDGDVLLEEGEVAQITIPGLGVDVGGDIGAANILSPALGPDRDFSLEIKPPVGGVMTLARRTPSYIDLVMDVQ